MLQITIPLHSTEFGAQVEMADLSMSSRNGVKLVLSNLFGTKLDSLSNSLSWNVGNPTVSKKSICLVWKLYFLTTVLMLLAVLTDFI